MQGHQKNSENKNIGSTSSNMVVIIFCYILVGCEDKAAMYMVLQYTVNRSREYIPGMIWVKDWNEDHDVDIFNIIQKVQDTVIHLEVDEKQRKITQRSKRQAQWVWSPRAMSCLRLPDTPHAQKTTTVHAFGPETIERRSIWRPTNDNVMCLEQNTVDPRLLPLGNPFKYHVQ